MSRWVWTALSIIGFWIGSVGSACTTFSIPQSAEKVVAKSYDWHQGHGRVIVNPRGLKKTALHLQPAVPATWLARFGSVTFNQYGRELPLGGMNEAGLVIEVMWLDDTEYPPVGSAPAVTELQWIQYHLDRFDNVRDVALSAERLKIAPFYAKVHYLACDRSGDCRSVEFLEGKPVISATPLANVLANDTYARSLEYLKKFRLFGGVIEVPEEKSTESLDRFAKAAIAAKGYAGEGAVSYAMQTLERVRQGDYTKFQIVYESASGKIHFRTLASPSLKTVRATAFSYQCDQGAQVLDINTADSGDVTGRFVRYTREDNRKMIETGVKDIEGLLPEGTLNRVAEYPDFLGCR